MDIRTGDITQILTNGGFTMVTNFREDLGFGWIFNTRRGETSIMFRKENGVMDVAVLHKGLNTCDLYTFEDTNIVGYYPNYDYRLWTEQDPRAVLEFFNAFANKVSQKRLKGTKVKA